MKTNYPKYYANLDKKSLARIRGIVKEPKVAFTAGDFQRASADRFAEMVRRTVREW